MPIRILKEEDVKSLITIEDAVQCVDYAFHEQANGTAHNLPRHRVRQPNGTLHLMGGALEKLGYWGFKAYTTTREGARFLINLFDLRTGRLLTLLEADTLGQMRTGAASAVATKLLAPPDAANIAIFGSGFQAETQLSAIASVINITQVRVFSPNPDHRKTFATRMEQTLDIQVLPTDSAESTLEGADVIITITSASKPVFPGNALRPGTHINACGSNSLARVEIDTETIQKVNLIFTDDIEQARIESGNFLNAFENNKLNWTRVLNLADVISGHHPGRQDNQQITLFESHGIAIWDIALAGIVYERAVQAGQGEIVTFLDD
jgi:alanine dehydrogenase